MSSSRSRLRIAASTHAIVPSSIELSCTKAWLLSAACNFEYLRSGMRIKGVCGGIPFELKLTAPIART